MHVPLSNFQRKGKGLKQISGSAALRKHTLFFSSPRKVQPKAGTGSSCRAMASSVPWAQPWELGTAGEGNMLGAKSREVKAVAPAPSHCIFRLANFGVQDGEDLFLGLLR